MADDSQFIEEMAREFDATIRTLEERKSVLASAMGAEHIAELEGFLEEILGNSVEQDISELERWLDSRDNEWISVVARIRHARIQRAMLGRLCMRTNIRNKQAD
jgi:hypothetical protein